MANMHMWEYGEQQFEHSTPNDGNLQAFTDVPAHLDVLPDGTLTEIIGNPEGEASFNHQQGDIPYGYQEDCGLVSAQDILNQFGIPVSEGDVV